MLTMGQAAKAAGTSKPTLSRAIATGRLSATRNDKRGWDIDPAELFRVFPRNPGNGSGNGSVKQSVTPPGTPETAVENAALKAEVEGLRAMLQQMREQTDDLKRQRDSWEDQAKIAQRVLVDMRPRRGWFGLRKTG